jgi:hypothetical protein
VSSRHPAGSRSIDKQSCRSSAAAPVVARHQPAAVTHLSCSRLTIASMMIDAHHGVRGAVPPIATVASPPADV